MNFHLFIKGFLILLLTPLLVIGVFAAYTHWINSLPSSALLQCDVSPQVVLTGDGVRYLATFHGDSARPIEMGPPPPLDILFAVDTSGSMHNSLEDMKTAARAVANDLFNSNKAGYIYFALSQFHDDSEIKSEWSSKLEALMLGLDHLDRKAANEGTARAFEVIDELIRRSRSNTIKVVVLYTDGYIGIDDQIEKASEALRGRGVKIYSISPPGFNQEGMARITGNPARVLIPSTKTDLVTQFHKVVDEAMGLYGDLAKLKLPLDSDIFSPRISSDFRWQRHNGDGLRLDIGPLSFARKNYPITLIPEIIGQWRVGLAPASIDFVNRQFKPETLTCDRRPALLVLSLWLLVLAFLPALLWLLHWLLNRQAAIEAPPYIPPAIRTPPLPAPLPLPKIPKTSRQPVVPSLFIGLGGAGRAAMLALKEQLQSSHGEAEGLPYLFMWLDLDAHEQERSTPFNDWDALKTLEVVAPVNIRQTAPALDAYLPPQSGRVPEHLTWFQPIEYRDAAADRKDLSHGSKGQRALARFALFQWLDQGDLLPLLRKDHQALLQFEARDELRQIVLIADRTGGVGSAWSLDIARLMRRIGEQDKPQFSPQIMILLCNSQQRMHTEEGFNRQALDCEMESARLAGAYPQRISFGSTDPLLEATDYWSPINYAFSITSDDVNITAQRCADLCALLVERYPLHTVLDHRINHGQIMEAEVRGIHMLPDLDHRLVQNELMLRLLGPDILLDLEPSGANDRLMVAQQTPEAGAKLLNQWLMAEPASTPWRWLLNAAVNGPSAVEQLLERAAEGSLADSIWYRQAFCISLNRQLHGQRKDQGAWQRGWMPAQAVVALRLFTQRLEQQVKPHLTAGSELMEAADEMIRLGLAAAEALEAWLSDLTARCIHLSDQRAALLRQRDERGAMDGHVRIDFPGGDERIVGWAEQAIRRWTGSVDTVSILRERLFFITHFDNNALKIRLVINIDHAQTFDSAALAVDRLFEYTAQAARLAPALKVESALAVLAANDDQAVLRRLADGMVGRLGGAEQVIRVAPTVQEPAEDGVIIDFIARINEPPGSARVNNCRGDDHSALRRLALLSEKSPLYQQERRLPFIQSAEQSAEAVRQRAMRQFNLQMRVFPASLRIALANKENFLAFSLAYQAGRINRKSDDAGVEQWYFNDQNKLITFDNHNTLADAAANFVYLFDRSSISLAKSTANGDFTLLDQWLAGDESVWGDDLAVLVAIRASRE